MNKIPGIASAESIEVTSADRPLQTARCPICASNRVHYSFSIHGARVLQCADCNFTYNTAPGASLPNIRGDHAIESLVARFGSLSGVVSQLIPDCATAETNIRTFEWSLDKSPHLTPSPAKQSITLSSGQLDASNNPLPLLRSLREQLKPGEPVIFVYSDARRAGVDVGSSEWEELLGKRHVYLDTQAALTVLYRAGFRCQGVCRLRRRVSLEELSANRKDHLVVGRWRRRLRLLPQALRRNIYVESRSADVAILAVPRPPEAPDISVVIPVYNEAATVTKLIDSVLRVEFDDAKVEIVIVESNSTDGSREIVQRYATHPRVTCIFEDRPRGKGHATRLGLSRASGDIIVIQDADLEYDVEDYHSLIGPILAGHAAFVLGSRHGGRNHWKLRQFGKPLLSKFYNLAHVLVTAYINVLFGLRLRDPQTMFKVFRRDCIEGLHFHGNYFNFDYELLLKIVRKGYVPVEVPVNYRSRSHAEGKKIRMWRDAPLGLWMITKLRCTPLKRFLGIGEPIG